MTDVTLVPQLAIEPPRPKPKGLPAMRGLDGLRALAVAAVFAYHAEASWLPGGFLGVDVFFVLSGYLITSLLLEEIDRTGTVSLRNFWLRRSRRLVPALVTVVVVCLVLAAIWGRAQLGTTRLEALTGLAYVANWHDALAHVSYFSEFGRPPLLRHLWSLSVEGQFYLLWPPLVIAVSRWGGARRVAIVALGLALASGLEMLLLAHGSPTRVYEGTDTRAGTLLVGAIAAVLLRPGQLKQVTANVPAYAVDIGGVVCLGGLIWLMTTQTGGGSGLFTGPLFLTAVLAAGLIACAAIPGTVFSWTLARTPLVWLGQRSYEIYLWHWPVIVLLRSANAGYGQSIGLTLVQVALTLLLSCLSFSLLDERIRRQGFNWAVARVSEIPTRARAGIAAGLLAALIFAFAMPSSPAADMTSAAVNPFGSGRLTGHTRGRGAAAPPSGPVMVFGDSVAAGTAQALTQALGGDVTVNAVVGRQPQDTIAAVAAAAADHQLPKRVVVSLGDNGQVTSAMLIQLHQVTGDVPDVVVVTPRVPDPWGVPSAATIRAALAYWPTLRIADWEALSANENNWFTDGVHPDAVGIGEYVNLITSTLDGPAGSDNRGPRPGARR